MLLVWIFIAQAKKEYKPTVHLLLIRHGQYNLDSDENELTELGKEQSRIVGRVTHGRGGWFEGCDAALNQGVVMCMLVYRFKKLISSDVLRAKQTAEIIHEVLGGEKAVHYEDPDPILAEGWPCVPMPMSERSYSKIRPARLLEEGNRLEAAYRKYVHRAKDHKKPPKKNKTVEEKQKEKEKKIAEDYFKHGKEAIGEDGDVDEDLTKGHEYYIVVCHMNVIRYFVCRALQLPPEAWLRMGGENCGITEIIGFSKAVNAPAQSGTSSGLSDPFEHSVLKWHPNGGCINESSEPSEGHGVV
ncbi:hypothetical protein Pmar_PMAR001236 [Perkinsus marinus ATCC 50983]|uniref:Serine/threonine-protein phosphatase PGAM5, mitochondrial n=1 Tax=Perkinsus marinus (strain ATCC 50983 / TXsc) TaxID=423536 RepID=C5KT88_PERM5|nr:hypothetical protein Pmar_PMAR001236 [Perkinsus marinus ATCC 50983]EER12438.1 hypothetical protein Pmar_PMAR001236 [Perkinsus marinus ATCC 50983]|eukprot:XP_002780643.1 hypothetical protein Pmar_PMAR001236 [Perkinsus marinus ATCC 50983]